jgi:hypothetical protein
VFRIDRNLVYIDFIYKGFFAFGLYLIFGLDFLEIDQSETRSACGGHVCYRIGMKCAIFLEDLP